MDEKKKLNPEELEQATGGWEYNGFFEWLKGYNIKCPNCGNENADVVQKYAASTNEVLFKCAYCQQRFKLKYTWDKPDHKTIILQRLN